MAYDEELADRVRVLFRDQPDVAERTMFGGLAFLIGGHMAVAASGQGGLLVRVDPTGADEIVATTNTRPMEMRGKPMAGWLRVGSEDLGDELQLVTWVGRGTDYVRTLPAKQEPANRRTDGRRFAG